MSKQPNFYEVLNSTPNSSLDELKNNYKQLILQCHPDKLQQDKERKETTATITKTSVVGGATVDPNVIVGDDDNAEFLMINKAWNTLKDPVKRKHYDAELLLTKFQMHSNVFEHLTLDEMIEHEEQEETEAEAEAEEEEVEMQENVHDKKNIKNKKNNDEDLPESKMVSYFYTYNCRCGGQYIIDESAAADNGIYKQKKNNSNFHKMLAARRNERTQQNSTQKNDCDSLGDKDKAATVTATTTTADASTTTTTTITNTVDVKVMVECSECSLVIMLSNKKQKLNLTDSTKTTS